MGLWEISNLAGWEKAREAVRKQKLHGFDAHRHFVAASHLAPHTFSLRTNQQKKAQQRVAGGSRLVEEKLPKDSVSNQQKKLN